MVRYNRGKGFAKRGQVLCRECKVCKVWGKEGEVKLGERREERRELMNIRRAGRKVVKNQHKGYGIYRIGFVNIYGEEDETELDVMNINDLERLWLSLCPEFECKGNGVCYVERVG